MAIVIKPTKYFDSVLGDAARKGIFGSKMAGSVDWFREKVKSSSKLTQRVQQSSLLKDRSRLESDSDVGRMYFFAYDPKHKQTLPYYDKFPLIFPVGPAEGGFYGINFHYLPYSYRMILMDGLWDLRNNNQFDETTKLKLSYQILQSASKTGYFRPCLKMYLNSHVSSRFVKIEPVEWNIAIFLPVESFSKASTSKVWNDSRKVLR